MSINDTQATALAFLYSEVLNAGEIFRQAQAIEGFWNVTRSQLYRELPKMAETGLVKASEPGARNAVNYKITAAGRKAFAVWLAEEGQVIVRDGVKVREHFRSTVAVEATPAKRTVRKRATVDTTEEAPAPKKRARRKAAEVSADA